MLVWQIEYTTIEDGTPIVNRTCSLSQEHAYKLVHSLRKHGISYNACAYTVHKWVTRYLSVWDGVWVELPNYSLTSVEELQHNLAKINAVQYTVRVY